MEHSLDNRGDDGEVEDDAALIAAFFLPGGILDPEDDSDMGYQDGIPYKNAPPFFESSLQSPVSLNPWETSQAEPVDAAVDWIDTHSPSSHDRLPEMLLPALSTTRQLGSISPTHHVLPPASAIVPPPGFQRSSSENGDSVNSESSVIENISRTKHALDLTNQVQIIGSISFADVIRSSPSATFASPERKSSEKQQSRYPKEEDDEKSHLLKTSTPRAKSSSPQISLRKDSARSVSVPNVHKTRTEQTLKQVEKDTMLSMECNSIDGSSSLSLSTEWNDVDRNSVGRATSKSDNIATTVAVFPSPGFESPILRYDSDDDNQSKTNSSSESLSDLSQDCIANVLQRSRTTKPDRDNVPDNAKADVSHTALGTEDVDAVRIKQCKVVESKDTVQGATAKSLSESSDIKRRYISSTQSEIVNSEIFAVLAPLLKQLMVSTSHVVRFLSNLTQLYAKGVWNILIYATREASFGDGTLSCYVVLYTLPMFFDWLMIHASLPHFLPHVLSTVFLYSLSHFPDQPPRTTASRVSVDACRLVLNAFRLYLPVTMILEGFRGPNTMIMSLDKSSRLVLAYLLSMLRAGFLLSPVGWLGWSIQVILSSWLPEGLLSSCILSLSGLALLHLTSNHPDHKTASI